MLKYLIVRSSCACQRSPTVLLFSRPCTLMLVDARALSVEPCSAAALPLQRDDFEHISANMRFHINRRMYFVRTALQRSSPASVAARQLRTYI